METRSRSSRASSIARAASSCSVAREVPELGVDRPQGRTGDRLAVGILELEAELESPFQEVAGDGHLPPRRSNLAEDGQGASLAAAIRHLPAHRQGLFEQLETALRAPQVVVKSAEIVEHGRFAGALAELPEKLESLP